MFADLVRLVKGFDPPPSACPLAYMFNYVFPLSLHPPSPSLAALSLRYGGKERERRVAKEERELIYSTGDCGNPLIKACILIHPKACLTVYHELLCDH